MENLDLYGDTSLNNLYVNNITYDDTTFKKIPYFKFDTSNIDYYKFNSNLALTNNHSIKINDIYSKNLILNSFYNYHSFNVPTFIINSVKLQKLIICCIDKFFESNDGYTFDISFNKPNGGTSNMSIKNAIDVPEQGKIVFISDSKEIIINSYDYINKTSHYELHTINNIQKTNCIAWSPELSIYVLIATNDNDLKFLTSSDAITWNEIYNISDSSIILNDIIWVPLLKNFISIGSKDNKPFYIYSDNGTNWDISGIITNSNHILTSITYSNEYQIVNVVGSRGFLAYAKFDHINNINWIINTDTDTDISYNQIIWIPQLHRFIAGGEYIELDNYSIQNPYNNGDTITTYPDGKIISSLDGINWDISQIFPDNLKTICWSEHTGKLFILNDKQTSVYYTNHNFILPTKYNSITNQIVDKLSAQEIDISGIDLYSFLQNTTNLNADLIDGQSINRFTITDLSIINNLTVNNVNFKDLSNNVSDLFGDVNNLTTTLNDLSTNLIVNNNLIVKYSDTSLNNVDISKLNVLDISVANNLTVNNISANSLIVNNINFSDICNNITILNYTLNDLSKNVKELSDNTTNLTYSFDDLSSNHYDLSDNVTTLNYTLNDLSSNHYDLSDNVTNLTYSFKDLSSNHYDLSDNVTNLTYSFDDLSSNHYDLSDNVTNLTYSFDDLSDNVTNLTNSFKDLSSNHYDLSDNVTNLTYSFDDLSSNHYDLSDNVTNLSNSFNDLSNNHYDLSDNVTNLTNSFKDLSSNHYDLSDNVTNLTYSFKDLSSNHYDLSDNVTTLNYTLKDLSTNLITNYNLIVENSNASLNNLTLTGELKGPSPLIINPAPDNNEGIVRIRGGLIVDGSTTIINSTIVDVSDKTILLASNATTIDDIHNAGLEISGNKSILYDYDKDAFVTNISFETTNLTISNNLIVNNINFTTLATDLNELSNNTTNLTNVLSNNVINLTSKLNELSSNFIDLSSNFNDLSGNFIDLSRNFIDLSSNFIDLSSNHYDLSNDVTNLTNSFNDLSINHYDLSNDVTTLSSNFNDLSTNLINNYNLIVKYSDTSLNNVDISKLNVDDILCNTFNSSYIKFDNDGGSIAFGHSTNVGYRSTSIGYYCGNLNQGGASVALGYEAGKNNQSDKAVAIGRLSGTINQGENSISIGNSAGYNYLGENSIAIGSNASSTDNSNNTLAIGYEAGTSSQNSYAVAIGYQAGYQNQGTSAVSLGYNAGYTNQLQYSVAIGYYSGNLDQSSNAIAIGYNAGYQNQAMETVAIGSNCAYGNTNMIALQTTDDPPITKYYINQKRGGIAIGHYAAHQGQGEYAINIGYGSGAHCAAYLESWVNPDYPTNFNKNSISIGNSTSKYTQHQQSIAIGYKAENQIKKQFYWNWYSECVCRSKRKVCCYWISSRLF